MDTKRKLEHKYGTLPFYVVDSLSATGGIGLFVERALYNKNNGVSIEDNYNDLLSLRGNTRTWFYVNDLDYLKAGGRISAFTHVIGTVLGVKPILKITNFGTLESIGNKVGNVKANDFLRDKFRRHGGAQGVNKVVYITHADALTEANRLRVKINELDRDAVVKIKALSPIIGAHTGPGAIVISHIGKLI